MRASAAAGHVGPRLLILLRGQGKGGGHENDAPRGDKREDKNENPEKCVHGVNLPNVFVGGSARVQAPRAGMK